MAQGFLEIFKTRSQTAFRARKGGNDVYVGYATPVTLARMVRDKRHRLDWHGVDLDFRPDRPGGRRKATPWAFPPRSRARVSPGCLALPRPATSNTQKQRCQNQAAPPLAALRSSVPGSTSANRIKKPIRSFADGRRRILRVSNEAPRLSAHACRCLHLRPILEPNGGTFRPPTFLGKSKPCWIHSHSARSRNAIFQRRGPVGMAQFWDANAKDERPCSEWRTPGILLGEQRCQRCCYRSIRIALFGLIVSGSILEPGTQGSTFG